MSPLFRFAAALLSALTVGSAHAQWKIDPAASELRFVAVKNTHVGEVLQFKRVSGELGAAGVARLDVDLASLETLTPIRNERMTSLLFEIGRFPTAQFEAKLNIAAIEALGAGEWLDIELAGKIQIHGVSQEAKAGVRVVKLGSSLLQVTTRSPVMLNASQFDLANGIEKLREIAGLPNISHAVPVIFTLILRK